MSRGHLMVDLFSFRPYGARIDQKACGLAAAQCGEATPYRYDLESPGGYAS
jgi:hypothetical protein